MISGEMLFALEALIDKQQLLEQSIRLEAHSMWMPGMNPDEDPKKGEFYSPSDFPGYLLQAITAINSIEYKDGQAGNETAKQKGVILVGPSSLRVAAEINEIKDQLAGEFKVLRLRLSKKTSIREALNEQDQIRSVLSRAGIGRLCVKQATRKLPIVESPPYRISWLEKRSNSIRKLTTDQVKKLLDKLSSEQAGIDKVKLQQLPLGTELAIVQEPKVPTLKATIFHPVIQDGAKTLSNTQIHAPVPILCATGNEMPVLNKGGTRENTPRSDVRISPEMFLPSVRAHLYL